MLDLKDMVPVVVYDNRCYLCSRFAKIVNALARGKFSLVGHYTEIGERIRSEVLDSSALDMFWFIDGSTAYGGRAALIPMMSSMLRSAPRGIKRLEQTEYCDVGCRTAKAVFVRSASLLTHSKKIKLKRSE